MTLLAFFLVSKSQIRMTNKNTPTFAGVIYFAGPGEDFPLSSPSIMQPLSGQPVLQYTLDTLQEVTGKSAALILDRELPKLTEEHFLEDVSTVLQEGSNLITALESKFKDNADHLLLAPANMPLLTVSTLKKLMAVHLAPDSPPAITAAYTRSPGKQHFDNQDQREYPAGVFCVSASWLWEIQSQLPNSLTLDNLFSNLVQAASSAGLSVQRFNFIDREEALAIESLVDLSKAETLMRLRTNHSLMRSGVTIIDPTTTYVDAGVEVGQDTIIHPNTYLRGLTRIGEACQIGPNSLIMDTRIGDRCEVTFSVTESAVLEDDVDIGPFAHLRKGAHLAQGVHMGNYGEVKNSYLGPGTKMGHFSYIGDANIGPGVNIGAGVITANYDGSSKYPTEIGAGAFIGSDTMLIAPLKIGAGARTGAGSVVNKDVPPNSLAVGIPARIIRKLEESDGS